MMGQIDVDDVDSWLRQIGTCAHHVQCAASDVCDSLYILRQTMTRQKLVKLTDVGVAGSLESDVHVACHYKRIDVDR